MKVMILGSAAAEAFPGLFCQCETCMAARQKGGRNIRARHSVLVNDDLLIDFNQDMVMHLFRFGLDYSRVEHLLVTHDHSDHFAPSELQFRTAGFANFVRPTPPLTVYGNESVGIKLGREYAKERVRYQRVKAGAEFCAGAYTVLPLTARHDPRQECLLYLVKAGGKSLLYGTDSGVYPEEFWRQLEGEHIDLALMDCTCGRDAAPYDSHMGFPQNIAMRQKMLELNIADAATKFVSTHYSHNGHADYDDMLALARGSGIEISYDGMVVEI